MISQQTATEEQPNNLAQLGHHPERHTVAEQSIPERLSNAFENSRLPLTSRLANFSRHTRRQDIARFLAKYELFKLALPANGSVVECGVFCGGGLASWVHFSACLEPYNHTRRVIGFDTFDGFPTIAREDDKLGSSRHLSVGAFRTHSTIQDEIMEMMAIHDSNRPVGQIPKVELVAGDAAAESHYAEALALAQAVGVPRLEAEPRMGLALVAARAGRLDEAGAQIDQALDTTLATGDAWLAAMLALAIGGIVLMGSSRSSTEELERALKQAEVERIAAIDALNLIQVGEGPR